MKYPLQGVKVLDISRVLAGPFAGRMFCDLGADLVKLEPPEGDVTRIWGARIAGQSGFFNQQNAGKKGICVDLLKPDGIVLLKQLIVEADILLENFRAGVMERLGIAWPVLQEINPRLIMCSISGFGQDGPEAKRAAYAPIIHAETGLVARQSSLTGAPLSEVVLPLADTNSALHGVIGVLAALYMREHTGVGQHLDISMMEAMLFTDSDMHYNLDHSEHLQPFLSEVWPVPEGGGLMVAGDFRHLWNRLTEKGVVSDSKTPHVSLEAKIHFRRNAVSEYFMSCAELTELTAVLDELKIAWGFVREPRDIGDSPTIRHRQAIVQVDNRDGGSRPVMQAPYRFSGATSGVRGGSPRLGEHNLAVLADWLGFNEDQVRALEEEGVLLDHSSDRAIY